MKNNEKEKCQHRRERRKLMLAKISSQSSAHESTHENNGARCISINEENVEK